MKIKIYKSKNQHSRPVVNYYNFSHSTIIIGSNNKVDNNEEVALTPSLGQGFKKDKKQSSDWKKTCEIIVVILKVIKQLLIIATPLFNMLC